MPPRRPRARAPGRGTVPSPRASAQALPTALAAVAVRRGRYAACKALIDDVHARGGGSPAALQRLLGAVRGNGDVTVPALVLAAGCPWDAESARALEGVLALAWQEGGRQQPAVGAVVVLRAFHEADGGLLSLLGAAPGAHGQGAAAALAAVAAACPDAARWALASSPAGGLLPRAAGLGAPAGAPPARPRAPAPPPLRSLAGSVVDPATWPAAGGRPGGPAAPPATRRRRVPKASPEGRVRASLAALSSAPGPEAARDAAAAGWAAACAAIGPGGLLSDPGVRRATRLLEEASHRAGLAPPPEFADAALAARFADWVAGAGAAGGGGRGGARPARPRALPAAAVLARSVAPLAALEEAGDAGGDAGEAGDAGEGEGVVFMDLEPDLGPGAGGEGGDSASEGDFFVG